MRMIFLDTETTGLDLEKHEVWEVAAIEREWDGNTLKINDVEHHWFLYVNEVDADPIALDIGKYWDRHPNALARMSGKPLKPMEVCSERVFAYEFQKLTHKSIIVGAVPDFDAYRLARLMKANGIIPTWDYHLICCEVLAMGHLKVEPPWKSDEVFEKLGIDKTKYERHTAMGDARMVRDIYDLIMGRYGETSSSSSDDEPTAIDTGF